MKKFLSIILLVFITTIAFSQNSVVTKKDSDIKIQEPVDSYHKYKPDTNAIHAATDVEPAYPGGVEKFYKFVRENVKELQASDQNIRVIVIFVVLKNGNLTDVKSLRSPSAEIANEVVNVIKTSQKWIPGNINGTAVNTQFTVSITNTGYNGRYYNPRKDTLTVMSKPHFPGGKQAYYKFLAENLHWPYPNKDIDGEIHLAFVVEESGQLTNIHIEQGLSPELNAEALRVVKLFPIWVPAKVNHKPVRYYYRFHINYKMVY